MHLEDKIPIHVKESILALVVQHLFESGWSEFVGNDEVEGQGRSSFIKIAFIEPILQAVMPYTPFCGNDCELSASSLDSNVNSLTWRVTDF
jgi:hypothetical protein